MIMTACPLENIMLTIYSESSLPLALDSQLSFGLMSQNAVVKPQLNPSYGILLCKKVKTSKSISQSIYNSFIFLCFCSQDNTIGKNHLVVASYKELEITCVGNPNQIMTTKFSVQSSLKLNLPPHLIMAASTVQLKEIIGQGITIQFN